MNQPMNQRSISNRLAAVAAALAGVAAAAGLLAPDLYGDPPYWAQQARGTDLATLFVAVPVLVLGLVAGRRGSPAGHPIVAAGLLYLIYNYAIFAFSVVMNPLAPVYIALLGLAVWSFALLAATGGRDADGDAAPTPVGRTGRRAVATLLVGVAVLFGLLWLAQIAAFVATGVLPPDLARAGLPTNPVYALDLALFLPLCAVAGIGLLRRTGWGNYALPMLIWVALMSAGILGGFAYAAGAGDAVQLPVAAMVAGIALAAAGLAVGTIAAGGRRIADPAASIASGA